MFHPPSKTPTICESRVGLRESYNQAEDSAVIPLSGKAIVRWQRDVEIPNWGKPEPIGPITPTITEFEQVAREYKLSPDQYLRSTRCESGRAATRTRSTFLSHCSRLGASKSSPHLATHRERISQGSLSY